MGKGEYKPEYTLLGQALNGPHAMIGDNCSVSGILGDLLSNLGDVVEGGWIVDKRTVDEGVLCRWVVSGPMLKASLPPGTMDRFGFGPPCKRLPEPCTLSDILSEEKDEQGCRKVGGFDYISRDLYLALWVHLGAMVGQRIGDCVHWRDGSITVIPPASERYDHMPWMRKAIPNETIDHRPNGRLDDKEPNEVLSGPMMGAR
jgi:hypothetical protein